MLSARHFTQGAPKVFLVHTGSGHERRLQWDGGGERTPVQNSGGDVLPEITIFNENFLNTYQFTFSNIFINKVHEIRGEIRIWG